MGSRTWILTSAALAIAACGGNVRVDNTQSAGGAGGTAQGGSAGKSSGGTGGIPVGCMPGTTTGCRCPDGSKGQLILSTPRRLRAVRVRWQRRCGWGWGCGGQLCFPRRLLTKWIGTEWGLPRLRLQGLHARDLQLRTRSRLRGDHHVRAIGGLPGRHLLPRLDLQGGHRRQRRPDRRVRVDCARAL